MKPKNGFQFSVGGPSILMIFVIFCLATFGVLSYVTANMDNKISVKSSKTVQNYYQANRLVQSKLEQVDGALLTAKSDAKKAVDAGTCKGLENSALYEADDGARAVFSSSLPKTDKYAACYLVFSRILLAECSGVKINSAQVDGGVFQCSFAADADQNRQIQVKLTVNPYESAERYQLVGEKLVNTQDSANSTDSSGTLQLWQGSSQR